MAHAPLIVSILRNRAFWGLLVLVVAGLRSYGKRAQRDLLLRDRFGPLQEGGPSRTPASAPDALARLVQRLEQQLGRDLSRVEPGTRLGDLCEPGAPTRRLVRGLERSFGCRLPPSYEVVSMTLSQLAQQLERPVREPAQPNRRV